MQKAKLSRQSHSEELQDSFNFLLAYDSAFWWFNADTFCIIRLLVERGMKLSLHNMMIILNALHANIEKLIYLLKLFSLDTLEWYAIKLVKFHKVEDNLHIFAKVCRFVTKDLYFHMKFTQKILDLGEDYDRETLISLIFEADFFESMEKNEYIRDALSQIYDALVTDIIHGGGNNLIEIGRHLEINIDDEDILFPHEIEKGILLAKYHLEIKLHSEELD